jgi:hypothetical protein
MSALTDHVFRYVVLGDFQTAVAFLLASAPERSAR